MPGLRRASREHRPAREGSGAQDSRSAARVAPGDPGDGVRVSVLADRLRGIIKPPSAADVVPRAAPAFIRSEGDLETLLDGRWYGHCFIVERRMAPGARYGRATIGELAARLSESAHAGPPVCSRTG